MPDEADRVERVVVEGLSTFLDRSASDVTPIPMIAEALGRLFERFLADENGWPRFASIDDVEPQSTTRVYGSSVAMAGRATIVDREGRSTQPFKAVFRLDPSRHRLEAFRLSFGDATSEMHAVPYGARPPSAWPEVSDWMFTINLAGAELPD